MQRGLLAGVAVLCGALAFGVIYWTGGEDQPPAEPATASQGAVEAESAGASTESESQPEPASDQSIVRATEEGAQPVAGETAAVEEAESGVPEGQVAALTAEPSQASVLPSFDVVRVEPNGQAVIAGRAQPGSTVILLDGGRELARVTADATGAWVIVLEEPLAPGDHQLGLRAEMADGSVLLSETLVVVSVPERTLEVAGAELSEQELAAGPDTAGAPLAVEIPREGLGASRVLQQPADAGLRDQALLLNAVDYDAEGFVVISGRAEPGARIAIYLDEVLLGIVVADAEGMWQLAPEAPVEPGLHRLRVDHVDDSGDVLARVATLFSRAELASGFPENRYVIVQPGNSLWRIARRTYGEGVRYSVIFQANNDQIADPDLIFPGQIFLVPGVN